jgi:hypothetical protein
MISGLLKLMRRSSFTGYQNDLEVSFKTYFITADNLASRRARCARFWLGTSFFSKLEKRGGYTYWPAR